VISHYGDSVIQQDDHFRYSEACRATSNRESCSQGLLYYRMVSHTDIIACMSTFSSLMVDVFTEEIKYLFMVLVILETFDITGEGLSELRYSTATNTESPDATNPNLA
jgi:hypothetical protein